MAQGTTKRDIVNRVAAQTNTPRPVVRQIVQQFLDDVVDELARGRRVEFRAFGVFETIRRKPRVARNPRTGLAIQVPAKTVVHFKPGGVMRERVAALTREEPPTYGTHPAAEPDDRVSGGQAGVPESPCLPERPGQRLGRPASAAQADAARTSASSVEPSTDGPSPSAEGSAVGEGPESTEGPAAGEGPESTEGPAAGGGPEATEGPAAGGGPEATEGPAAGGGPEATEGPDDASL